MNSFQSVESVKKSSSYSPFFIILGIVGNTLWMLVLVVLILRIFVYQQVQVEGLSMFPNYDNKQYLLVNQIDKTFKRGQVVAVFANRDFAEEVAYKMNPIQAYLARFDCKEPKPGVTSEESCKAKFYLKRIIGLPGEEIEIIGGNVIIYNDQYPKGVVLEENYIPQTTVAQEYNRNYYFPKTKIPTEEYFVMGDNRSNSMDSRIVGTFPNYSIFGQENFRILPFDTFHLFKVPEYVYKPITDQLKQKAEQYKIIIK